MRPRFYPPNFSHTLVLSTSQDCLSFIPSRYLYRNCQLLVFCYLDLDWEGGPGGELRLISRSMLESFQFQPQSISIAHFHQEQHTSFQFIHLFEKAIGIVVAAYLNFFLVSTFEIRGFVEPTTTNIFLNHQLLLIYILHIPPHTYLLTSIST